MSHKGQAITGLIMGIGSAFAGATWIWNSGLSLVLFNDHANIASLTATVAQQDKKLDWLIEKEGGDPIRIVSINKTASSTDN